MNSSSVLAIFSGAGGSVAGGGTFVFASGFGLVGNDLAAVAIQHTQTQIGFSNAAGKFDFFNEGLRRRQGRGRLRKNFSPWRTTEICPPGIGCGDGDAEARLFRFQICRLTAASRLAWWAGPIFWMGYQILAPRFGFAGLQKTEVGLVVRVNAGHDFDVGRELAVASASVRLRSQA